VRERVATVASHRTAEAMLAAACTIAIVLARRALPWFVPPLLAFGGAALAIDLARREHREPGPVRPLAWVITALLVVAVLSPARLPNDLRPYAADGRIVAHYHRNPYVALPHEFASDPVFARVRDAPAPYGPLFLGAAAASGVLTDATVLPARLPYQAGAALAVGAALLLLWRTRRSTAALALVGLHPAVAGTIVNGGHNDAFIGLALLAAVLAAERRRYLGAGTIVAAGVLVKATAGLALVPLAVWSFARGGRRAALAVVGPTALLVVPLTLATPGMLHAVHATNRGIVTRTSIWNLDPLRAPVTPRLGDGAVTQLAIVLIAVAVVIVSVSRRSLAARVTGATAAWLVLSAYVMPWYTVWALPVAALEPRRPMSRVVAWQGAVATAAFLVPHRLLGNWFVSFPLGWIASVALLVAFVRALRSPADGGDSPEARIRRALPGGRSLRAS
jgi:hypothetical protein